MELYEKYMKEREGIDVIYNDNSFITYKKINDHTVFVYDMFSVKELRGEGIMLNFCKKFVENMKKDGIKFIIGTTVTTTNGWENSDRLLRKFGFKFSGKDPEDETVNNYYLKIGDTNGWQN